MACSMPYASGSYVSALNKKTVKESNRWPQPQQSVTSASTLHSYSSGKYKTDDGGWSMGTPEKGSGWGSTTTTTRPTSDSWSNLDTNESDGAATITESVRSTSSDQSVLNNVWLPDSSERESHQRPDVVWTKDNEDEESRSHSPGGLTMIASSRGDNETFSAPQDDDMGISNWGDPKAKPVVGNNWKIQTHVHEKDNFVASDWDDSELSNSQCPTVSNGNSTLNKEHGHLEFESSSLDRYDPAFVGETSHSGAGTPNSRSSGGATPTQETGGRTSAGSTSSVNSIGSSSSWKSDGKGSKTYANRLGSPRKPNRYDRSNSLSGASSIGSDKDSNCLYKTRKPKKSLAELEGGLGSLHCEPSGWGELPSPTPCDVDNGTELWGVPPVDQNRLVNKGAETNKGSFNGPGLADTITQVVSTSSIEWRDEDSSGTMAAGWNKDDDSKILAPRTPTIPLSQWGPMNENSWGNKLQDDVSSYSDSRKTTVDAKSPREEYLNASVDGDHLESVDEASSDIITLNKRFSKGSSPDSAHGNSKEVSTMKQTPPSAASGPSFQNQFLFLKLLQGNSGQQVLTQRLGQLQMQKQQLIQQLNQLNRSGMNTALQQNQNQAKLATINQMITQINQQLMILSQLSSQQKEVGRNVETCSTNVSSPKMIHNSPLPMRLKSDPKGNGSFSRSQSANAMVGLGVGGIESSKSLAYGLQGLSLNSPAQSSVSQSSVRSMSRLQQIISGSSNDNLASLSGKEESAFQSSLPMIPGSQNGSFPASVSYQQTSPFSPPQGRSLTLGSDSHSFVNGGTSTSFTSKKSVSDIQEFRPGVPWQPKSQATESAQVYCKQNSVPTDGYHDSNVFSQQSGPQQSSFGSNIQLMRSQSTSGSYYNSAAVQNKYYGQGSGYEKPLNLRMGRKTSIHGHYQSKPPTPSPELINVGSGWKPKGRTIVPPSSLYPPQDFHYKPGYGSRKHQRMAGQSQYNTTTDQKSWDSSFSAESSSSSSSMISSAVWGPDPNLASLSKDSHQQGWSQGHAQNSHNWMDTRSNQLQHNPSSSFTSLPSQSHTSPAEYYTPTSVDSLASSRGTWSQDEVKHGIVSSEPSFAEWQAGKRAQLSVGKFPSNPPSQWLIIRNTSSQFNEDTLREQFNKCGAVYKWIACPALDCSLLHCQSTEDSIHIKEYVDSNSGMVGSGIIVQFASKTDVENWITEQNHEASPVSWFSESTNSSAELPPPEDCNLSSSASPSTPFSRVLPTSGWDSSSSNAPSLGRQSSEATTPGSSLWSDSGFLSGLSSPWHGSLPISGTTAASSSTSPQGNAGPNGGEPAPISNNPSMSPFLPNGLL